MNHWDEAEKHAQRAHKFFESGQWSRAAEELREALSVNPDQDDWHFGLALTLDAMGHYEKAIKAYKEVIKIRGEDIQIMLRLGIDQIRAKKPKDAVKTLEQIEQQDSRFEPAYCHAIVAYTQMGDHDNAELKFYLAQQITDECPLCYDHIAQSLAMRGKMKRAIYCWEKTLKLSANHPQVMANLANAHWQNGELEKAHQYFEKQLRRKPANIATIVNFGNLLIEMGKYDKAKEKFNRALEINPDIAEAHIRLGALAIAQENFDSAQKHFTQARTSTNEKPAGLCLGQAKIEQLRGNNGAAIAQLEQELNCHGHTPPQIIEIGRMLIELKKTDWAMRVIAPLIKDSKNAVSKADRSALAMALVCSAIIKLQKNETETALKELLKAKKTDPDNSVVTENLALVYLNKNKLLRAKAWIKKTCKLRPLDKKLKHLEHLVNRKLIKKKFFRLPA